MNDRLKDLRFGENGLLPAIVQDASTREVLMLAYMNHESLQRTLETGQTHFWSRSRGELWHKGATSGNTQTVQAIRYDCDADALLIAVIPAGPACHTGMRSCFHNPLIPENCAQETPSGIAAEDEGQSILRRLAAVVRDRKVHPKDGSYTCRLLAEGREKILKKVGEEAFEVALASVTEDRGQVIYETADLVYHMLVLLGYEEISLDEIASELEHRVRP